MYTIKCNKEQLMLIGNACEYLWRHLIWQKDFRHRRHEFNVSKEELKEWYSLTDIRKQVMHQLAIESKEKNKDKMRSCHDDETFKMWEYDLVAIEKTKSFKF
jgi:hypothetical protein